MLTLHSRVLCLFILLHPRHRLLLSAALQGDSFSTRGPGTAGHLWGILLGGPHSTLTQAHLSGPILVLPHHTRFQLGGLEPNLEQRVT